MGRSSSPSVSGRGSPDVPQRRQRGIERGLAPFASERLGRAVWWHHTQLATS